MKKRDKIIAVLLAGMLPVSSVFAFDKVKGGDTNLQINEQYAEETEVYPIEGIKDGEEVPAELLAEVSPPDTRKAKRFIIKYKDNKNKVNSEKIRIDLSSQYDVKNVKEFKLKKSSKFMFFSSEKEEQLHVVEVNEEVDVNEFTDDIETEFDVEYVQPDYKIDLSSLDNTIIGEIESHSDMKEDNITSDSENIDISFSDALNEEQAGTEDNTEISTNEDAVEDNITSEDVSEETTDYGQNDAENTDETDVGTENEISADTEPDKQIETTPEAAETEETTEPVKNNEASETELTESEDDTNIVALIDTGVDIYNEALVGRIYNNDAEKGNDEDGNGFTGDVNGWDFYNDIPEVYNAELGMDQAHGTHIAGIIAETATDAKILPLKVFENGVAYTSDIIEAIQYAEMMGAKVVNCSWGCTEENSALKEAMESSSMTFVCASGNNRLDLSETPIYPACYGLENIVSVTSVNDDGGLSYFSNYGDVDIASRGRDIESCFPGGEKGTLTGTSVSAGFVSGALISVYTDSQETIERLYSTSDKLMNLQGKVEGGRRLNIENLISNTASNEIIDINPVEDFDQEGYTRTPAQSWDLFSSLDNVAVKSGKEFFAVLKANGTVWTWGKNNYGQLGIGSYTNTTVPQQVPNLQGVKQLEAGTFHAMALTESGLVYAWGHNAEGELGNGTTSNSNIPVKMLNTGSVKSIGIGEQVSFVIRTDGSLYICGLNYSGEQCDSTGVRKTTLHKVPITEKVKMASGEYGSCMALTENGKLYTWGSNGYGKLGIGGTENSSTPQVVIDSGVIDADMGYFSSTALTEGGQVYFWGHGGTDTPSVIENMSGASRIEAGRQVELVLCGNIIKGRGANVNGSVGVGDTLWHSSWTDIQGEYSDCAINHFSGIALGTNGCVYTWGVVDFDTNEYVTAPEKVSGEINDFGGDSFSEAATVEEGLTHGNLISTSDKDYYKFTPNSDGIYSIYSISTGKDLVCKIYTLSSSGSYSLKFSNDDVNGIMGDNKRDFYLSKPLKAGTEYYIYVYPYGSRYEGEYELHIERESSNLGYSFYAAANASNDVYFNVQNLSTFSNRTFTMTYDSTKLKLADACIFTEAADTTVGAVAGTNITIVSASEGELVFKITQSIPSGKKLSGTINVIRFTSLVSGYKTVNYKVNDTSA